LWKDVDTDLSGLEAAKAEYEKIKKVAAAKE
jgi:hypothetical protein